MKYLLITDIPTPWREKVYEGVYQRMGSSFHVAYCGRNEKRRLWNVALGNHPKTFLPSVSVTLGGVERFFNPSVVPFLWKHRPSMVVCFGLNPTMLLSMATCRLLGIKILLLSDTWEGRDQGITWIQKLARQVVFRWFGDAYVGASRQTLRLFRHYNRDIKEEQLFLSWLCADNEFFQKRNASFPVPRQFDLLFAGRVVPEKNPIFFAEVCARVRRRLGRCSALILGEGREELKARMREIFQGAGVDFTFAGFIQHENLPDYYAQAKALLLPTAGDCWGVVLNEAMVAGTPVVTTPMTAAAGELVLHGRNGYVLELDAEKWCSAVVDLLSDSRKWDSFSRAARETVAGFTFDKAAAGLSEALRYVENTLKRTERVIDGCAPRHSVPR
jgi:glycosyltransferase involved in cell wall biosynthesis